MAGEAAAVEGVDEALGVLAELAKIINVSKYQMST